MPPHGPHDGGHHASPHAGQPSKAQLVEAANALKKKLKPKPGTKPVIWIVTIRKIPAGVTATSFVKKGAQTHDIYVRKGQPLYCVDGVNLISHAEAHTHHPRETIVVLDVERGDSVIWVSRDEPFALAQIGPADGGKSDLPFDWLPPAYSSVTHRIASGPAMKESKGRLYKATFAIGNTLVDPDMFCF